MDEGGRAAEGACGRGGGAWKGQGEVVSRVGGWGKGAERGDPAGAGLGEVVSRVGSGEGGLGSGKGQGWVR